MDYTWQWLTRNCPQREVSAKGDADHFLTDKELRIMSGFQMEEPGYSPHLSSPDYCFLHASKPCPEGTDTIPFRIWPHTAVDAVLNDNYSSGRDWPYNQQVSRWTLSVHCCGRSILLNRSDLVSSWRLLRTNTDLLLECAEHLGTHPDSLQDALTTNWKCWQKLFNSMTMIKGCRRPNLVFVGSSDQPWVPMNDHESATPRICLQEITTISACKFVFCVAAIPDCNMCEARNCLFWLFCVCVCFFMQDIWQCTKFSLAKNLTVFPPPQMPNCADDRTPRETQHSGRPRPKGVRLWARLRAGSACTQLPPMHLLLQSVLWLAQSIVRMLLILDEGMKDFRRFFFFFFGGGGGSGWRVEAYSQMHQIW